MTGAGVLPDFDIYAESGLSREATPAQVARALPPEGEEHHQDVATDKPAAEARMKRINQARDILLDGAPTRRLRPCLGGDRHSGRQVAFRPARRQIFATPSVGRDPLSGSETARHAPIASDERGRMPNGASGRVRPRHGLPEKRPPGRSASVARGKQQSEQIGALAEREAAAQAARERRAQAAAERAARKERARRLGAALLRDDTELLSQIHADGVVDWSRQRASARFQAERAVAKTRAIEELRTAVASDNAASVRAARRMAAAVGAEAPADLRVGSRGAYRTRPRRSPVLAGRSRQRTHQGQPKDRHPPWVSFGQYTGKKSRNYHNARELNLFVDERCLMLQ